MRIRMRKRGIREMGLGMRGNWWKCGESENEGNHGCDDREWEEKPGIIVEMQGIGVNIWV